MKTSRILAFVSLLILLTTLTVRAQQDETVINQIKERISKLEAIDRDKNTPDDIRILNRGFLKEQRAQLHTLLKNKLDGLVKYQSDVRSALTPDQNSVLEKSIRSLEADLRNLENDPPDGVPKSAGNGDTQGNPSRAGGDGETRGDSQPAGTTAQPEPAVVPMSGGSVGKCPAKLFDTVRLIKTTRGNSMRVRLLVPLSKIAPYLVGNALSIPTDQVVIVTKPSNTIYTKGGLAFASAPSPPGPKYLTITLNDTPALPADDNEASIMLNNLPFDCNGPTIVPSTTATGKIYGKNNLGELADEAKKALDDAAAHAKTSDEKNIFAGFAAAKGQGGKTAGDADISFNKTLWGSPVGAGGIFDKVVVSFQAKKSSGDKADPRHFTTGITFRKTMLLQGRKLFNEQQELIRTGLTQPQSVGSSLQTLETNNETLIRRGFFRALLIDETLNLEGEAFDFKTVNFVSDTQFKVASISKKLFGTNGFWNLRLVAGPELGRNLNKPGQPGSGTPTTPALNSVNWITRFKTGAQLALRYLPADNSGTNWGVELDLAFVNRHLFSNEVLTDVTNTGSNSPTKTITVGKGNKAWRQADLKIFPFGDEKARYGFKLSYTHGQLPPAFTFTKSFQYGFVIETKDDKSSGKPANQ